MTYLYVEKTASLAGDVFPPSSKSQSIRGLILGLMAKGESVLLNPLNSDDMQAAMNVCTELGATLAWSQEKLIIRSPGLPLPSEACTLFTSNSGITTRFVMPLLGLRQNGTSPIVLDCGEHVVLGWNLP